MRPLPFTLVFALALPLLATAAPADVSERIPAVRDHLRRLERLGFAGAVLVTQGDRTLLADGFGFADREQGRRWTTETVSTIGSITKQFTGAAIVALAEDGRLSVDDLVTAHFEGVPTDKKSITLHHLLTHTSGIVDLAGVGDHDPIDREEFVRRALQQPLAFAPGEGYEYSNAGYSLLGAIIEQVTGETYEEYLRERFLLPSGMHDTGYVLADFDPARVAQGYRDGERWGTVLERPMAEDGPYWVLRANGGIHSTLEDMNRWARALLEDRVLSSESMELYWSPHVDEGMGDSHYGYGWVVMEPNGTRVVTHNGGNGVLFADMAIAPSADLVVALQCNVIADFRLAGQLLQQIGHHLLFGEPLPAVPDPIDVDPEDLAQWTGRFEFGDGSEIEVRVGESGLAIVPLDREAFTFVLSSRDADPERAARLSARIEVILAAWLEGDVEPLWHAYGGRVTRERLSTSATESITSWTDLHGAVVGHSVLGTAFRDGRDVTLARVQLEHGHVDRAYVWEPGESETLLGVSIRGLDPVLHALPEADGGFSSWDPRSGLTRPLRFEITENGSTVLRFGDAQDTRAVRVTGSRP